MATNDSYDYRCGAMTLRTFRWLCWGGAAIFMAWFWVTLIFAGWFAAVKVFAIVFIAVMIWLEWKRKPDENVHPK